MELYDAVQKINELNEQIAAVDKNCRKEYGDYVFYSVNDDRVWRHVDTYYSNIEKGGETLETLLK